MQKNNDLRIKDLFLERKNRLLLGNYELGEFLYKKNSQNHLWSERRSEVDTIVFHYISAEEISKDKFNLKDILRIFCIYGVSSHFLITRNGIIYRLVPEEKKAWHCGGSILPEPDNRENVNDFSIGIEFVASKYSGFTQYQYNACNFLIKKLKKKFKIKIITGHDKIAGKHAVDLKLRKDVKTDPGNLFKYNLINSE